jgi:rhamnosyltransferase
MKLFNKQEKKPSNKYDNVRIAIIGVRGISNYGGFETYVAELGPFLTEKGFQVYTSCEIPDNNKLPREYKGINLLYFPLKPPKNYFLRKIFEMIYDAYFILKCSFFCDIIYVLGLGGHIFLLFPRLLNRKVIINFGGLEWEREKFSLIERKMLKFFFKISVSLSNIIIIDNEELIDVIAKKHQKKTIFIPYWVEEPQKITWDLYLLKKLNKSINIKKKVFWLTVARLGPDNNIEMIIEGYLKSESKYPFVIVGDFMDIQYKEFIYAKFGKELNKVTFLGAIYNQELLNMLRQNCFAYIHGHSMGGTNPALLEAMIMKNKILVHNNKFTRSVCQETVLYFLNSEELKNLIEKVELHPEQFEYLVDSAYNRVKQNYNSRKIICDFEKLIVSISH